jgi:serine/threonine protein phosphatase 1
MKRYFIFTDVHGHYDELMTALKSKGYRKTNPNHIIVSIGDNFDRGPKSVEVYNFLKSQLNKGRAILLKGNHELLLAKCLKNKRLTFLDDRNGLYTTVEEYRDINLLDDEEDALKNMVKEGWLSFINDMGWYLKLGNYILTHSWIPHDNLKSLDYCDDKEWKEAVWADGPSRYGEDNIFKRSKYILINGHRFSWIYKAKYEEKYKNISFEDLSLLPLEIYKPFKGNHLIALDACTELSKLVNILIIDEKENNKYVLNKELSD